MVMGLSSMIVMLGMMSGPIVAGLAADHFGDYRIGFTILAAMSACGSIFFALATKPNPPGAARRVGDEVRDAARVSPAPTG